MYRHGRLIALYRLLTPLPTGNRSRPTRGDLLLLLLIVFVSLMLCHAEGADSAAGMAVRSQPVQCRLLAHTLRCNCHLFLKLVHESALQLIEHQISFYFGLIIIHALLLFLFLIPLICNIFIYIFFHFGNISIEPL